METKSERTVRAQKEEEEEEGEDMIDRIWNDEEGSVVINDKEE